MEFTLSSQIFNFLASFLFGVIFSVFFDLVKIAEFIFDKNNRNIRDIVYFTIISLISFLLSLAVNNGGVSLYIYLAELLGWFAWHFTLSKVILGKLKNLTAKIKNIILFHLKNEIIKPLERLKLWTRQVFENNVTKIKKRKSKIN